MSQKVCLSALLRRMSEGKRSPSRCMTPAEGCELCLVHAPGFQVPELFWRCVFCDGRPLIVDLRPPKDAHSLILGRCDLTC